MKVREKTAEAVRSPAASNGNHWGADKSINLPGLVCERARGESFPRLWFEVVLVEGVGSLVESLVY